MEHIWWLLSFNGRRWTSDPQFSVIIPRLASNLLVAVQFVAQKLRALTASRRVLGETNWFKLLRLEVGLVACALV